MNTTANNTESNGNGETKTRKARLPITKRFLTGEGEATVSSNGVTALSFQFGQEDVVDVPVIEFADHATALLAYGIRSLLNGALVNVDTLEEAKAALLEKIAAIKAGNFSDRGGERGINVAQFIAVLAAANNITADQARNIYAAKAAALEDKEIREEKDKEGNVIGESDAFDRWIAAVRATTEYKTKASELFPRERKGKDKAALADLLS